MVELVIEKDANALNDLKGVRVVKSEGFYGGVAEFVVKNGYFLIGNSIGEAMGCAASAGSIEIIKFLNKDVQYSSINAMHYAAYGGYIDIVKLMIGIETMGFYNPERLLNKLNCSLFEATRGGHVEIVNLLIENGANKFNNAICYAARGGHIGIIKLLIQKGAFYTNDPNTINTVMTMAARNGHLDSVKLLIDNEANNFNDAKVIAI